MSKARCQRRETAVFQYVMRRLLLAVPMLLGAMSMVFFAMRVLPGDPCTALMGDQATRDALQDCVRDLGLERPVVVQERPALARGGRSGSALGALAQFLPDDRADVGGEIGNMPTVAPLPGPEQGILDRVFKILGGH